MSKKSVRLEEEETVYVLAFVKRGGGVVVSKGRVPASAIKVDASRPPDALDQAIGWGTARLVEDMQRGKL